MQYKYLVKSRLVQLITFVWLAAIVAAISFLFWQSELRYSLPTPIPKNYHAVKQGDTIAINYEARFKNTKPLFLHFFNPACPCSRFNIPYFKALAKKYNSEINFAIVVQSNDTTYTEKDIQEKFGIALPVLFNKNLAVLCGVYSTPQAVLINTDHTLYYRGNYNKSRYCSDPNSNYAQQAIASLLTHQFKFSINETALKSYGCQLPNCTNQKL
jgi:hypothetical protein